jgi:hypothetical protein
MTISIQTNNEPKPPRILIYGTHGVGKSTFGSLAPAPVFLQTEDGLDAIDTPHFPLAKTYSEVMGYLGELASQEHNYKTLVVDSVDWLERLMHDKLCQERSVKSISDISYGKGYEMVLDLWREYISAINWLRENKAMTIVQIAHAEIKRFENPETEGYDRYQIKLHNKAGALIEEHSDIVMFANYFVATKKSGEGFKEKTKAVGTGDRFLYTMERPAFKAKSRYALPEQIPFDKEGVYWSVLAQHVPYLTKLMNGE